MLDEKIEEIKEDYSSREDVSVEDGGKIDAYTDILLFLHNERMVS
jgi:hypothetical protein